jgi:hypothetical protein
MRDLPSGDPHDPDFRRLRYVRYCDDHLLGFTGPKAEAEEIKRRLAQFLREDLKLELSQDKTLITHARSDRASFLGYEISVQHDDRQRTASGQRAVNGAVSLHVPKSVIQAKSALYLKRGQPARRSQVIITATTTSSGSMGPNTEASSSTTCLPVMSDDYTGSAGSCCPRC